MLQSIKITFDLKNEFKLNWSILNEKMTKAIIWNKDCAKDAILLIVNFESSLQPQIWESQKLLSWIYYNIKKVNNGGIKKNDGILEINLEKVNLQKAVGNLI